MRTLLTENLFTNAEKVGFITVGVEKKETACVGPSMGPKNEPMGGEGNKGLCATLGREKPQGDNEANFQLGGGLEVEPAPTPS